MSEKAFGVGPAVPVSLPQFTPIARSRRFHVERTLGVGLTLLGIVALIVIAIMSILGPGLTNLYIAVGVVGWIPYARITRGETLATRHLEYVLAARTIGCSSGRIMLRHILPNVIAPALIYVFTGMVLAILTGATLSFLGLGPQPPTPEWGAMIAEGRQYLLLAWWMTTLPGLALLVVGVALSLIGDGLAERRGG